MSTDSMGIGTRHWSSPDAGVPYYNDEGRMMGSLWRRLVDIGGTRHPPPLLWAVWPEDLDTGCHTIYILWFLFLLTNVLIVSRFG